jgi:glycosyltransferase involved in cell wall biosynthesis
VSIVIPSFNHERLISQALDSAERQDYPFLELLICDDGSTDDTYSVAANWIAQNRTAFNRVELVRQKNRGIPKTLNRLILMSRGVYVKPLASDDILCDKAISQLVDYAAKKRTKKLLALTDFSRFVDDTIIDDSAVRSIRRYDSDFLAAQPLLLRLEVLCKWGSPFNNAFFSRSLFDEIGGYDEALPHEDVYFAWAALGKRSLFYYPLKTMMYRVRPGQEVTPGLSREQYYDVRPVVKKCERFFEDTDKVWWLLLYARYHIKGFYLLISKMIGLLKWVKTNF